MTRIGILDDEVVICETLKKQLTNLGYDVPEYAMTFDEGLRLLDEVKPDIMLLDVNLKGEKTGIDFAHFIRKNHSIPLIFVTSYSDKTTVKEASVVEPNGYLLKPFSSEDLFVAIETALSNFSRNLLVKESPGHDQNADVKPLKDAFFIKQDQLFIKIRFEDILFIRADGVYIEIMTINKKFVLRETLKNLLDLLPKDQFCQTHRSYIVQYQAIEAIHPEFVVIKGVSIPISRANRDDFLKRVRLF